MARLEKRPTEDETSVEAAELELVWVQSPPHVVSASHVPVVLPALQQYVIPPSGTHGRKANDNAKIVRPQKFTVGEF